MRDDVLYKCVIDERSLIDERKCERSLMLFDMQFFVSLTVGQVKPKNNLPEASLACLGQALVSNPALTSNCYGNFM